MIRTLVPPETSLAIVLENNRNPNVTTWLTFRYKAPGIEPMPFGALPQAFDRRHENRGTVGTWKVQLLSVRMRAYFQRIDGLAWSTTTLSLKKRVDNKV